MEIIEVREPGLFTTVQDLGRYGYQRYGVPVSGALDLFALRVANILVGNREGVAGLEVTWLGPKLRFLADTVIALTGADLGPQLNGQPLPMWQAAAVPQGSILSFVGVQVGMRTYLAIASGIEVPLVLGSRSTYTRASLGGLEGRALRAGDRLRTPMTGPEARMAGRQIPRELVPTYGHHHTLRVVLGPHDDAFTTEGLQTFLSSSYTITPQSDRMGYRLQGPRIEHKAGVDIISDGIPFGAVQVTGDGMPIVLLADRGTTGGYSKIATVISTDIARLAQAAPGDEVSFQTVSVEEAHQLLRQQEALVQRIRELPLAPLTDRRSTALPDDQDNVVLTPI